MVLMLRGLLASALVACTTTSPSATTAASSVPFAQGNDHQVI